MTITTTKRFAIKSPRLGRTVKRTTVRTKYARPAKRGRPLRKRPIRKYK